MKSRSATVTDEMKQFLQEGLANYASALVALSEFRRQIGSRLESVLREFSAQLAELGTPVSDLRLTGSKLDAPDLSERSARVGVRRRYSASLEACYFVEWNLDEAAGEQLWVGAWIWTGKKADRAQLFETMKKHHTSQLDFDQYTDGTAVLTSYCDADPFHAFGDTLRILLQEWIDLLSAAGGVRAFASEHVDESSDTDTR